MGTNIQTSKDSFDRSSLPALVEAIENDFGYQSWRQIKTIIAVSGGPDSVALLRGMLDVVERNGDQPENLIVAHVDHGLRGSESDADAKFVEALAKKFGLEFVLANSIALAPIRTDDSQYLATKQNSNEPLLVPSEERLRNFRYDNLLATATRLGARYIVTGHNLNDQIETILFRIFRGTGLAGLAGIPPVRLGNPSVTIVRPLLKTRRAEIEAFLAEIKQDFRVDSSNSSPNYQRNYLRNELIPLIESRFGSGLEQALLRLGCQAVQANEFIESQAERIGKAIIGIAPDSVELDCTPLQSEPPILIRQFLVGIWSKQNWPRQAMGFEWWDKICSTIGTKQSEKQSPQVLNLPGEIRFSRNGDRATFTREPKQSC